MSGSLIVLARQSPLNGGVTVPGAQLFVYDAGTTTKRAIYTTSALSVQHDNPVDADANGRFPAVWVNPDGGAYKTVLAPAGDTDPPASPFWTEDNIPVLGSAFSEDDFTGALTGYASGPTGTVNYRIFANASGTGKSCTLYVAAAITGTSNANTLTMTGLPAACQPATVALVNCVLNNNTTTVAGIAHIAAAGSTITFYMGSPLSATGFTTSGTKGLPAGWSITYPL